MAQVRAKVLCFVDNGLRNAGDEFDYEGPLNTNLEYLDSVSGVEDGIGESDPAPKKWTPKAKRETAE